MACVCVRAQELAFAQAYHKPLVVVLLEHAALDLLTQPDGADRAWSLQPATGDPLSAFVEMPLTPGVGDGCLFSKAVLKRLYTSLASELR